MEFSDKVSLVTGAARGIGAATAKALLERGCKRVLVCDVLVKEGKETASGLEELFGCGRAAFFQLDVASQSNFREAFEFCRTMFGCYPDIVVNNAGIVGEQRWEVLVDVILKGVITGTKLALEFLSKDPTEGTVVNIASMAGLPLDLLLAPVYSAAKAGVVQYTRAIGHPMEFLEHGVRIMCLCPNITDTALVGAGREDLSTLGPTKFGATIVAAMLEGIDTGKIKCLSPDDVAKGICTIISEGESGSVWGIDQAGENTFQIKLEMSWDDVVTKFKHSCIN